MERYCQGGPPTLPDCAGSTPPRRTRRVEASSGNHRSKPPCARSGSGNGTLRVCAAHRVRRSAPPRGVLESEARRAESKRLRVPRPDRTAPADSRRGQIRRGTISPRLVLLSCFSRASRVACRCAGIGAMPKLDCVRWIRELRCLGDERAGRGRSMGHHSARRLEALEGCVEALPNARVQIENPGHRAAGVERTRA